MKRLENESKLLDDRVGKLSETAEECNDVMKELKIALYAKFESAINLDE